MFYKLAFKNGCTKLINMKAVASIDLNKRVILFNYSVPNITGSAFFVDTSLVKDKYSFDTREEAEQEYAKIEAFLQQEQKMVKKELQ